MKLSSLLMRVVLLVMIVLWSSACSLRYFNKPSPPFGTYWHKQDYDIEETSRFMIDVCGYGMHENYESEEQYFIYYHRCMLNHGFSFMEDAHNVVQRGYSPLDTGMCTRNSKKFMYNTPGCQSYREKHPESGMWLRRFFD